MDVFAAVVVAVVVVVVVVAKAPYFSTFAGITPPFLRPLGAKILFNFNSRNMDSSE